MTSLEQRMAMTVKGQASWADPDRFPNKLCNQCVHFQRPEKSKQPSLGVCRMVRILTGRQGAAFAPTAKACSQFNRVL